MMYTKGFIFQKVSKSSQIGLYVFIILSIGATIVNNTWYLFTYILKQDMLYWPWSAYRAISHDPKRYTDPDTFNPKRFFDEDGNLNNDDVEYTFGFGKRRVYFWQLPSDLHYLPASISDILFLQTMSRALLGLWYSKSSMWLPLLILIFAIVRSGSSLPLHCKTSTFKEEGFTGQRDPS